MIFKKKNKFFVGVDKNQDLPSGGGGGTRRLRTCRQLEISIFQEIMRNILPVLADTFTKKYLKMPLHILAFQNTSSIFYFFPIETYIF